MRAGHGVLPAAPRADGYAPDRLYFAWAHELEAELVDELEAELVDNECCEKDGNDSHTLAPRGTRRILPGTLSELPFTPILDV